MLIETIKNKDKEKTIKLVCVEVFKSNGKNVPSQIHSVPALITLPNKNILFGKDVFDYLLSPSKGKLYFIENNKIYFVLN